MIPAWQQYFEFVGALSVLAGVFGWQRKGSVAEDEVYAEAAEVVLDAVSDADATRMVDCRTGKNWREQISLQEAIELHEERELRGFGWRRN